MLQDSASRYSVSFAHSSFLPVTSENHRRLSNKVSPASLQSSKIACFTKFRFWCKKASPIFPRIAPSSFISAYAPHSQPQTYPPSTEEFKPKKSDLGTLLGIPPQYGQISSTSLFNCSVGIIISLTVSRK